MYKIKYLKIIVASWSVVAMLLISNFAFAQGWTRHYINQLPDTSFAIIEFDEFRKKHRHSPYRDPNGQIDMEQLIYCLGTLDREQWIDPGNEWIAKKRLEQHYQRWVTNRSKTHLIPSVQINTAPLAELVQLPHIGPVLAVNIVEYRKVHSVFETFEDLGRVKGVGQGTLNAIRFYITIE